MSAVVCPTCGCEGDPCVVIATDTFSSDTIANYTSVTATAGTWNVSGGKLQCPSVGILKHNTSTPASPDGIRVSVVVNFAGGTGKMGVLVDYVDVNNYLYVEVESQFSTTATLRLIDVTSGSPTTLESVAVGSFNWSSDMTIRACWDGTFLAGTAVTTTTTALANEPSVHGGNFTGLRTVNAQLSATFDDLAIDRLPDSDTDCPACSICDACDHFEFQIDLSGIADNLCTDCEELNGSWVVERKPPDDECFWYEPEFTLCGAGGSTTHWLGMAVLGSGGTTTNAIVVIAPLPVDSGLGGAIVVYESTSPSADCTTWSNESMPHDPPDSLCNATSSTCTVTAL